MSDFFFDSSALVKAYIVEIGTLWVRAILDDPQHNIYISALAEVEVVSALTRRFNEGDLTRFEVDQASDELRQDCVTYSVIPITPQIMEAAVDNARNYSLRAYDAVQLASAIAVSISLLGTYGPPIDFTLVSADDALNEAARRERVQVENPNLH